MRPTFLAPLIALLLAAPSPALAQDREEPERDYGPWVTVNICDTPGAPNAMGVRASLPGNGRAQRMYVRFTAQYYSRARKRWRRVRGNGRSPWIYAGSARYRARQAGWTFRFRQPRDGATFLVRAYGDLQWRKRKRRRGKRTRWVVAKRKRRTARSGIVGVDDADPPGTSLGSCYIR